MSTYRIEEVIGRVYKLAGFSAPDQYGVVRHIPLTIVSAGTEAITATSQVTCLYASQTAQAHYVEVMFGSLLAYNSAQEEVKERTSGPSLLMEG